MIEIALIVIGSVLLQVGIERAFKSDCECGVKEEAQHKKEEKILFSDDVDRFYKG